MYVCIRLFGQTMYKAKFFVYMYVCIKKRFIMSANFSIVCMYAYMHK